MTTSFRLLEKRILQQRRQQQAAEEKQASPHALSESLRALAFALDAAQQPQIKPDPAMMRRIAQLEQQVKKLSERKSTVAKQSNAVTTQIERDANGIARAMSIGHVRFLVKYDAAGLISQFVPENLAPELTYPGPAKINARTQRKNE